MTKLFIHFWPGDDHLDPDIVYIYIYIEKSYKWYEVQNFNGDNDA